MAGSSPAMTTLVEPAKRIEQVRAVARAGMTTKS
jgi:hypothetical protein